MRCWFSALVSGALALYQFAEAAPIPQGPIRTNDPSGGDRASISRKYPTSRKLRHSAQKPLADNKYFQSHGPYGPTIYPDTAEAFLASEVWNSMSEAASTPVGYELAFRNLQSIDTSPHLLEMLHVDTYDPLSCAIYCNKDPSCKSFTLFAARVPKVEYNGKLSLKSPSISKFGCTFFGTPAMQASGPSKGFRVAQFHKVYAGANVYNKIGYFKRSTSDAVKCNGGPVVRNGGFEMDDPSQETDLSGWNITNVISPVTWGLTKPGSPNHGGTYAFDARLLTPYSHMSNRSTGLVLSQEMNTCPGQHYGISMEYRFDDPASGNCSITLGFPFEDTLNMTTQYSGDEDGNRPHTWITMRASFQAVSSNEILGILLNCVGDVWNNYSIDNVVVDPID